MGELEGVEQAKDPRKLKICKDFFAIFRLLFSTTHPSPTPSFYAGFRCPMESTPFLSPDHGSPTTLKPYGNLFCAWDTARKRAGLPDVRMHDLRHSFASNMVNAGQSIYVVGKLLGHSQVKTTQRYAHLSDATLHAAMDVAANAAVGLGLGHQRASA